MGLSVARLDHDRLGRDRVADVHGRRVVPLLVEEDAARPGELHGHEGVEQPGRQAALDDEASDARPGRELGIEVERVPVARQLRECLDCVVIERPGPGRPRPDRRCLPAHPSTSRGFVSSRMTAAHADGYVDDEEELPS